MLSCAEVEDAAQIELVVDRNPVLPDRWNGRLALTRVIDSPALHPDQPKAAPQIDLPQIAASAVR